MCNCAKPKSRDGDFKLKTQTCLDDLKMYEKQYIFYHKFPGSIQDTISVVVQASMVEACISVGTGAASAVDTAWVQRGQ